MDKGDPPPPSHTHPWRRPAFRPRRGWNDEEGLPELRIIPGTTCPPPPPTPTPSIGGANSGVLHGADREGGCPVRADRSCSTALICRRVRRRADHYIYRRPSRGNGRSVAERRLGRGRPSDAGPAPTASSDGRALGGGPTATGGEPTVSLRPVGLWPATGACWSVCSVEAPAYRRPAVLFWCGGAVW